MINFQKNHFTLWILADSVFWTKLLLRVHDFIFLVFYNVHTLRVLIDGVVIYFLKSNGQ